MKILQYAAFTVLVIGMIIYGFERRSSHLEEESSEISVKSDQQVSEDTSF